MTIKTFQIFRAGNHVAMNGRALSFSEDMVARMAGAYRESARKAVLTLGHPANDEPVLGVVRSLLERGAALYAVAEASQRLVDLVRSGAYRKVSASFIAPGGAGNPTPHTYYLKHVGFLGASPPAVKGMAELAFGDPESAWQIEGDGLSVSFAEHRPSGNPPGCVLDRSRVPLHQAATEITKVIPGMSYREAVGRLIDIGVRY